MDKEAADIVSAGFVLVERAAPNFIHGLENMRPWPSEHVPTMGVDKSGRVFYLPDFVKSNKEDIGFFVCHELWHWLGDHHHRAHELELAGWRARADAVMGNLQARFNCSTFPQLCNLGGDLECNHVALHLFNQPSIYSTLFIKGRKHTHQNDTLEAFVTRNIEECEKEPPQPLKQPKILNLGSGACGCEDETLDGADGPNPLSRERVAAIRNQVARDIAAQRGHGSSDLLLDWANSQLKPPRVDWRRHLVSHTRSIVSFVKSHSGSASHFRPHRHTLANYPKLRHKAPILPVYREFRPNVSVIFDTSGSMSYGDRGPKAASALIDLLRTCTVTGYAGDYSLQTKKLLRSKSDLDDFFKGGGGTSMAQIYDEVLKDKPHLIFIFTDGETDWPSIVPVPTTAIIINTSKEVLSDIPHQIKAVHIDTD